MATRILPLLQTPLKATWNVAGKLTDTSYWPAFHDGKKVVVLLVPGNPGLVDYYTTFCEEIHDALSHSSLSLDIIAVSHLGHSSKPLNTTKQLFTLQEQIQHKIECFDIIRKQYGPETKIVLIGHSVGSFICTEVLKARPNHNIVRLIALFPTLQHIAKTPNGVALSPIFPVIPRTIVSWSASLLSWIHPTVRKTIVSYITKQPDPSLSVTSDQLLQRNVVNNALFMAGQEMASIKELDYDFYHAHVKKFIIYFSPKDSWAPQDHYDDMKSRFPNANITLCEENLPHAFVLDHAKSMAKKVSEWILNVND
ncbi:hypothetical protein K450DRAFT_257222 [Umbelopsis ramanniana AG]|uniref:Lipid droplet-associated hydrolase n=1 Tax=Umbelopsis ramanniana AG TaxID=1314678 RepID=A0AAD5E642_UMBRA|nr:uncharacterized protein K450DRAFT_257222 [Umbelopsis ramanniana AG]KAI8576325.1 hypothetical protein K450DRAFT_257222 [Umbelopsis ramanniana AG]